MLLALALSGCVTPGRSGLDAELVRQKRLKGYDIVSADHHRAVFAAKGVEIAVVAAKGFCLAKDSLEASQRAAFALIADCVTEMPPRLSPTDDGGSMLTLPPSFPGLMTVAISDLPEGGDLDAMEAFLKGANGRQLLSRGKRGASVEVLEVKRIGGALYLHLADSGSGGGLFAPRFWRALVAVRGRLVLVTVSGFRDRPMGDGDMLAFLAQQVAEIRGANGGPVPAEESRIAARVNGSLLLGGRTAIARAEDGPDTDNAAEVEAPGDAGPQAPAAAPRPPVPGKRLRRVTVTPVPAPPQPPRRPAA